MPKFMLLWSSGEDAIEVYQEEPTIVVKAPRYEYAALAKLEYAQRPGIYILYDNLNTRYVGQASGSINSRLKEHLKNKKWWTDVIILSREDGKMDKSQLDYLEAKLIKEFQDAGFEMDNSNNGNTSHIEPYQKGKASQVLSDGLRILKESAHLDLFRKSRQRAAKAKPKKMEEAPVPAPNSIANTSPTEPPQKSFTGSENLEKESMKTPKIESIHIQTPVGEEVPSTVTKEETLEASTYTVQTELEERAQEVASPPFKWCCFDADGNLGEGSNEFESLVNYLKICAADDEEKELKYSRNMSGWSTPRVFFNEEQAANHGGGFTAITPTLSIKNDGDLKEMTETISRICEIQLTIEEKR